MEVTSNILFCIKRYESDKYRPMELRQLKYLEAMLACGTFAAAAERERVAQPALWLQLRKLEDAWGVRLFERGGRRLRPTRTLELLRGALGAVLSDARRLGELVGEVRDGRIGPVRLPQTPYPHAARAIAEATVEYAERHPAAPLPI